MHYTPHALLNCVAWFSLLLSYGNAARLAPKDGLSNLARTVGLILEPTLAAEHQNTRPNRSINHISRRQVDASLTGPAAPDGPLFTNQGFPLPYRYPPYNHQLSQNFFRVGDLGNQHLVDGISFDPRLFQQQLRGRPLEPLQLEVSRLRSTNSNGNPNDNPNTKSNLNDDNAKDNRKANANSIQNLDSNGDSKSSAQSRPFESSEFLNQPGGNIQDPGIGNLRVDNRFSAIDYERIRQNYYSDPPINQQRNYYSTYNDIPLNSPGPAYRPQIGSRYSGLNYNGGGPGRPGLASSDLRSGTGIEDIGSPYFNNGYPQAPYRSFGYSSLSGGGGSGSSLPFPGSFGSPFSGPEYSGGAFDGPFYPGAGGGASRSLGFVDEDDSSLRASAARERVAEPLTTPRASLRKPKEPKEPKAEGGEQ